MTEYVTIGIAQRPGTGPPCADGYHPDTVRYAGIAPAVITHLGQTLGGLAGLITAGQMARAYDPPPHLSAVYARIEPGRPTVLAWIGDCRAYGLSAGGDLTQWSTDQTMGQFLREHTGVPTPQIAAEHDAFVRLGLAQASAATCLQAEIPEDVPVVVLCSDGASDQVDQATWLDLCRRHGAAPQRLAEALTAAATATDDGYRDDTTVIVLRRGAK
jgi:serine/threonine protein phosphatase PrpC